MSKLNAYLVSMELNKETCTICGEETLFGGYWMGMNGNIVLCNKEHCHEKLIELLMDALFDSDIYFTANDYGEAMAIEKRFVNFASRVFWKKMFLRATVK